LKSLRFFATRCTAIPRPLQIATISRRLAGSYDPAAAISPGWPALKNPLRFFRAIS